MIKLVKWISVSCFFAFIGLLILISVAFAVIQTNFGKTTIQEMLIKEAAKHQIVLTMDPIKGRLPFRWKISHIEIKTPDDLQISIYKIKGRISFFALLRGELFFKSLKLFHIQIKQPSSLPFPTFTIRGKGKWIQRRAFLGLNVRAFVDEDPLTALSFDAHFDPSGGLKGSLFFSTPSTKIISPFVDLPLDGPASLQADFKGDLKQLHFQTLKVATPLFNLHGEMTAVDFKRITHAASSFNVFYPIPIDGTIQFKDHHLEMRARSPEFVIENQEFSSASLTLDAKRDGALWDGAVRASIQSETLPLDLTAKLSVDPSGELALKDLYFLAPNTEVGGKLCFHFPQYTLDGALFAQSKDLSLFRRLWPQSRLKGQCGGEITFSSSPIQTVGVHLLLDHFQFDEVKSKQLTLKLNVQSIFSVPEGIVSVEAEDLTFRNLFLEQGSLQLHSEKKILPFEMRVKGVWDSPLDLTLKGSISPFAEFKEVSVDTFDGALVGKTFHLKTPFTIAWSPTTIDISECALTYSGGWLNGQCHLSKENSEITLKSEHFPLELLSHSSRAFSLTGGVAIDLEIKAKQDELSGHLNLLLEHVRLFQFGKSSPLMAKGSFSANINKERLQLHSHLISSGHQFFTTSASLPVHFSHEPKSLRLDRDKPFSAQVFLDGRVEEIFDFLNLGSQEIKGHVMGQIFFSNTLSKPQLKGGLRMINGGYENFTIGTSVKDVELVLVAENQQLLLKSISGKGPKNGTITGSGALSVVPEENFPFHFETSAENITGIDFDMLSARISGPIYFDGSMKELLIHGKVKISSADFKIPDNLPVDILDYPVQMIHPPAHMMIPTLPKRRYPVRYDFKLKAEDHIMVHGRGLSSEWKGKAHIKGEGGDYKGEGQLSLLRGEFNFSGKRFSLTKGEITFSETDAQIDLRGNLQLADATITAVLSGSLTAPSLTFQSSPSMPTSSILARLIFNKDMSEITPFQAIQLAQMIVTLSGDSGPNVLEKIRKTLGVDRFNIVSSGATGEDISLQIGKYLTQGVMITLAQSAHSSQVIVEVELKCGFIFQAETQEEEEGKFSLKWNHNY